jgi:cellulose synthase/poly-beta-1,6-N-acetylglucosamine synthase-like glycosyltransferase
MNNKRLLEIFPGFVSWNLILFPIWGGYFFPEITAYFILAFVVYSVYRSFTLTIAVVLSYFRIQATKRIDWMKEVEGFGDWKQVRHVVIVLLANEPPEVAKFTIEKLAEQTFPLKQLAVVVGTEARIPRGAETAESWRKELGNKFGAYIVTAHPAGLPGEIIGKSSNENWAAREAKKILVDEKGWKIEYMTVTSNDSDAVLDRQYFACLTFKFLDDPNRYERFWQPAIVFYKNIWKLPAATRVVNTLSGLVNLGALSRKDRLVSFSNYSASFAMIVRIGYWDTDVIPEDYRIFFKAFFALGGRVEVEPIFLPSIADAPESTTTWKTLINDYQQKKRWAWGVSDIPLFIEMFSKNYHGSFVNKLLRLVKVTEQHLMWPVHWFIITIGAMAASFVNPNFQRTTIGFLLPQTTSALMSVTLVFLAIMLWIDAMQRPPRPKGVSRLKIWLSPIEFVMMPIVGFFFSALPGLDAHTRLMLGKYLEYRITEKVQRSVKQNP